MNSLTLKCIFCPLNSYLTLNAYLMIFNALFPLNAYLMGGPGGGGIEHKTCAYKKSRYKFEFVCNQNLKSVNTELNTEECFDNTYP